MDPAGLSSVNGGDSRVRNLHCRYSQSSAESAPYSISLSSSSGGGYKSSLSETDSSVSTDGSYDSSEPIFGFTCATSDSEAEASMSLSASTSRSRSQSLSMSVSLSEELPPKKKKQPQRDADVDVAPPAVSKSAAAVGCYSKRRSDKGKDKGGKEKGGQKKKKSKFKFKKPSLKRKKKKKEDACAAEEELTIEDEHSIYFGMGHRNSRNPSMNQAATDLHSRPYEEYQKGSKFAQLRRWISKFTFRSMWHIVRNLCGAAKPKVAKLRRRRRRDNAANGALPDVAAADFVCEAPQPYRAKESCADQF